MTSKPLRSRLLPQRCYPDRGPSFQPMKRIAIPLWILVLLAVGPGVSPQDEPGYFVVVHKENPTGPMEQKVVQRIFWKKIRSWPEDKVPVIPVDQSEDTTVRVAFTKGVYGKNVSAILKYWQHQIFSGRDVPPRKLANDAEVLDFVGKNRGAIGYVSSTTEPVVVSQTKLDGTIASSRMIDGVLHVVLSNYQDYYYDVLPRLGRADLDLAEVDANALLPKYEHVDADGVTTTGDVLTWQELYRPTDRYTH